MLEAREQERASISRRVHDELGQALTALQWDVAKLTEQIVMAGPAAPTGASARLAAMASTIASALHTVRTVATELRPPMLDEFGLAAAIRWQAGQFQDRYGVLCDILCEGDIHPDPCVATAIFRIFQETLTNVARHASASRVRIKLNDHAGFTSLVVEDDGIGIGPGSEFASLGILGMRERARLVGGTLEITSSAGSGTTVRVRIPSQLPESEAENYTALG